MGGFQLAVALTCYSGLTGRVIVGRSEIHNDRAVFRNGMFYPENGPVVPSLHGDVVGSVMARTAFREFIMNRTIVRRG